jgi:ketosteroid isomerase-like protein
VSLSTASPLARADASSQKNAVQVLQDYTRLVSPEHADEAFDLFSEDALLEFPFFRSIGIGDHLSGREAIRKQVAAFIKNETENFRLRLQDCSLHRTLNVNHAA